MVKGAHGNYLNHIYLYFMLTNNTTARVLETGKRKDNDTESPLAFMLYSKVTVPTVYF